MSATAVAADAPAGDAAPASGRARAMARHALAAELALGAVTLGVVVGLIRLFAGWGFLPPLVLLAVATHLVLAWVRRRGGSVPLAALAVTVTGALVIAWSVLPESLTYLLPGPRTLGAARDALAASWQTFQSVVAPAPVEAGFVLTVAVALVFAVFLADWAAFRLWSPWEALVPAATLFVFASLLGSTDHRVEAAATFAAAVLLFLLLHRVARLDGERSWLQGAHSTGAGSLIGPGLVAAVVAVTAGALVGPHLPGAQSPAVWSFRGGSSGPGSRTTLSPLVDIQDRLVSQADVEVFTVRSDRRAYWRMTSLDTFEGEIWRSGGKYAAADGDLPGDLPTTVATGTANQQFRIGALDVLWLPAAFEPRFVHSDTPDAAVRYQSDSATLIVDTELANSDGLAYQVRSEVPSFTEQQLRAGTASPPPEIAGRYLSLPGDFSPTAAAAAARVTAAAPTPYDKARTLQDWFQTTFTYSLDVPKGHGESAIEAFLRDRRGYCEQFAGTYAAMIRAVGVPARVAVGFTPGDPDPSDPKLFHVRGEHAHAWPEVWIAGAGWVAMEPTPGRGAPGAEAWTGRPEQQDESGPARVGTTLPVTTTQVAASPGSLPDTTVPTTLRSPADVATAPPPVTGEDGGARRVLAWITAAVLLLALAAVAWVAAAVSRAARRRAQRRAAATDPPARVRVAWQETAEELALAGAAHDPSETHEEYAHRVGDRVAGLAGPMLALARAADTALYAPELVTHDDVTAADGGRDAVVAAVAPGISRGTRLRQILRPGRARARARRVETSGNPLAALGRR